MIQSDAESQTLQPTRRFDLIIFDSIIFDSTIFDSIIFDSVIFDSIIFETCILPSYYHLAHLFELSRYSVFLQEDNLKSINQLDKLHCAEIDKIKVCCSDTESRTPQRARRFDSIIFDSIIFDSTIFDSNIFDSVIFDSIIFD